MDAAWNETEDGELSALCGEAEFAELVAEMVHDGGGSWSSVSSPDRACRLLGRGSDITARLVWVTPPTSE